ncbi:MAG TPA: ATP-binding protein, partial [Blastocatellia bacterium]|nr:ATP-binding protein [Blastocatellia bacterium]
MNRRDFISDALNNSTDLIAYDVSRKLQEFFTDRAVIESSVWSFDLAEYVRAGHCAVVGEACVYNKSRMELSECGKSFVEQPENAWFNVFWRGNLLDVILLTWHEEGCRQRHHWIIADTRQIADEFLSAVCDWGSEVHGEILVFDRGYWSKNQELFQAIASARFENLILSGNLKEDIRGDFARFFNAREMYEQYGIPWKRGVLLIGPPGNGKTHT